ncbi:MAG: gamma-glutamyltransferase, partial [Solirubrobacteraceae bacterium]
MVTRYAPDGLVAAANHLAAAAGAAMLDRGGNAADAAIATAAAMAVTGPHMCGLGGDMFALVAPPGEVPVALNASGRAGSGADAARLRAEGHERVPFQDDVRAVTIPGLVDGLTALHARFGSLDLAELLAPARRLARDGFSVSPTLAAASGELSPAARLTAFGAPEPLTR